MWSRKAVVGAFGALLALFLGLGYWSNSVSYEKGVSDGITAYHQQCTIGGVVTWDGSVVQCTPLGKISEEELKKFKEGLDKAQSIVYNIK